MSGIPFSVHFLERQPPEILREILLYADVQDVVSVADASPVLNERISNDIDLWRAIQDGDLELLWSVNALKYRTERKGFRAWLKLRAEIESLEDRGVVVPVGTRLACYTELATAALFSRTPVIETMIEVETYGSVFDLPYPQRGPHEFSQFSKNLGKSLPMGLDLVERERPMAVGPPPVPTFYTVKKQGTTATLPDNYEETKEGNIEGAAFAKPISYDAIRARNELRFFLYANRGEPSTPDSADVTHVVPVSDMKLLLDSGKTPFLDDAQLRTQNPEGAMQFDWRCYADSLDPRGDVRLLLDVVSSNNPYYPPGKAPLARKITSIAMPYFVIMRPNEITPLPMFTAPSRRRDVLEFLHRPAASAWKMPDAVSSRPSDAALWIPAERIQSKASPALTEIVKFGASFGTDASTSSLHVHGKYATFEGEMKCEHVHDAVQLQAWLSENGLKCPRCV